MKKISLFGFNFNKKLYSIGYDGPIIDGYLFFGDTQIARARNDGNGGGMYFTPFVPRIDLNNYAKKAAKRYRELGVTVVNYDLIYSNTLEMLVEDLIHLEIARRHCMKQKKWNNPAVTVYTTPTQHGVFLETTISDDPIHDETILKRFLGDKIKMVGSYTIDRICIE